MSSTGSCRRCSIRWRPCGRARRSCTRSGPTNHTDLRYQFSHGDVERAFATAAAVVEGEYRLNFVTPACLGTMVAIADWDAEDRLTMSSTTQVPFLYQRDLAQALGIGGDRVRVLQPPVGGNFGRGLDLYPIDVIAALLARARAPAGEDRVRAAGGVRGVSHARAVHDPAAHRRPTREGRLLARDCHVVIDNGAYVSWGSTTPYVMLSTVAGLYRCPAVRFDTTIAYTNNPYSGSMRGYGNLESTFAVESQMDELADRLGLDRLEIRRRNVTRPGDANPQGFVITSCAMGECLDAVADEMRRAVPPPAPGWKRGVGYAGMFHVGGGARIYRSDGCGAILKCDDFGRVSLITGASEIGQGSETVLAMIVAETLGVPLERVDVVNSDTIGEAVGRRRARQPHDVRRRQRRAPGRREAARAAAGHGGRRAGGARRAAPRRRAAGSSSTTTRSGASRTTARRAPGTCAGTGRRWWPRRSTIRRPRCSTRICAATCRRRTASPPRRWWSTWSWRPASSGFGVSSPPTTSAGRSTRWPPRDRSTGASTWDSATR